MTNRKRITLKIERTPEELVELKTERERYSLERPDAEELIDQGDLTSPYRQGNILALLSVIAELKRRRDEQDLSLTDVSERSGLNRALISRLETWQDPQPDDGHSVAWRIGTPVAASGGVSPYPPEKRGWRDLDGPPQTLRSP